MNPLKKRNRGNFPNDSEPSVELKIAGPMPLKGRFHFLGLVKTATLMIFNCGRSAFPKCYAEFFVLRALVIMSAICIRGFSGSYAVCRTSSAPIRITPVSASDQHRFWDKRNCALFVAAGVLNGADFAVTRANLQSGG